MDRLDIDYEVLEEVLVNFVKDEVTKAGFNKVVLGLSGGIDSALVAFIATKALGAENVLGIMMPYKTSSPESLEHAKLVIDKLGIKNKKIEITPMVEAYFEQNLDMDSLRRGNKMARERMSILFDHSAKERALVIGTSNKTELLLGYGTQFGDSASAINPIGDLYKKHVWELSKHMGVPTEIIEKKPSADLWAGQSDEDELGYSYKIADEILYSYVEEGKNCEEIVSSGYQQEIVEKILKRVKIMQYKRVMPVVAKVMSRGIGTGFRHSRDWGL